MDKFTHTLKRASVVLATILLVLSTITFIAPNAMLRADTKDGEIVNVTTSVNVRKEPTTKSDIVVSLTNATKIKVEDTVAAKAGDTSGSAKWCKVTVTKNNQTYTGYIAETYVKITGTSTTTTTPTPTTTTSPTPTPTTAPSSDKAFEDSIAGFPDSYKSSLRELHKQHPKWKFVMETAPKNWNEVLDLESRNGCSLVQNTVDNAWKSKAAGAYDPATKTYKVIDSPNWVNASRGLIAYYLDPRTNLNNDGIFQFLDLSYDKSGIGANPDNAVAKVLNGTFMHNKKAKYDGLEIEFSKLFSMGGYEGKTNPIFLAARSVQEVGVNGSSSSDGKAGYYNFYNIGAYSDATNSAYVGLKFAQYGNGVSGSEFNSKYLIPWNCEGFSIIGGARWIGDFYVSKGQNTIYYMRFNVSPKSATKTCYHQYMTATQSATSEAKRMYNAYSKSELLDTELTFVIPVYTGMPSEVCQLPTPENAAADFVNRAYELVLNRKPSADELKAMSTKLVNGEEAVDLVGSLFESDEFARRKLSIDDQIKLVYKVLLNRDADEAGFKYYKDLMSNGYGILYPFAIIANSKECRDFMDIYSVNAGTYVDKDVTDNNMAVKPFVERLYSGFMCRTYDAEGLRHWMVQLSTKKMTGQEVAEFFYGSPEFQGLNLGNEEFIKRLYNVCLGREADADGLKYWLGQFDNEHHSKTWVLQGFLNSAEFNQLCDQYKINKSTYYSPTTYQLVFSQEKTEAFVTRLYSLALGREPDPDGFNYWVGQFKSGANGRDVAYGFVFSQELSNKSLSDEEFVEVLYKIFLDRASDADGKAYWTGELKKGTSRQQVFNGFIYSEEFGKRCIEAGILPYPGYKL